MLKQFEKDFDLLSPIEKVRVILLIKGKNLRNFADEINVTNGCVNNVLHGHYFVERVALAIVKETGIPFDELWPNQAKTDQSSQSN